MSFLIPQEAEQIAIDAYISAFSMLENYKTMYAFSVNKDLPSFRAPFNQFFHMSQLLGPEFTEVGGPNNDTLYSTAWLDLGTEPILLSVPNIPEKRYYVFQVCDMYTFNNEDGSVTIYLQHESPGPDREANWLPAPDGPFALSLRIYWPEQDVLDGKWQPAAIQKT